MPDPTGIPGGSGAPQQPQQTQQTRQPQQTQYSYPQIQQPQYNYQQPQQTQYSYQQPQYNDQQPYGTRQQPQQPQYYYQQPRQPYGYQQPPYGYRQPQTAPAVTHKKAVGSMIMMLLALTLLAYPLARYIVANLQGALDYGSGASWMSLIGHLCLAAGLILMLVGAIIGSRGSVLFGVGLLICLVCQLVIRIYFPILNAYLYNNNGYEGYWILLLALGVILVTGTVLAAIGCLARVKALKIVGGILMLVNFVLLWVLELLPWMDWYGSGYFQPINVLYFVGILFACIAVLAFPLRRVRN